MDCVSSVWYWVFAVVVFGAYSLGWVLGTAFATTWRK